MSWLGADRDAVTERFSVFACSGAVRDAVTESVSVFGKLLSVVNTHCAYCHLGLTVNEGSSYMVADVTALVQLGVMELI